MINSEEKVVIGNESTKFNSKIIVANYSPTLILLPGIVVDCKDMKTTEMANNLAKLLVNMEFENIKFEIYDNTICVKGIVLGIKGEEFPINGMIAFYYGQDNISLMVKFIRNTMSCPLTWGLFQTWYVSLFESNNLSKETSFYIDGRLLRSNQEFTIARNQSDG
jgi:hypothetical protein